ncbi:MAG TPA: hypothetical protein VFS07_08630 [Gemmatimonadales bacterium]|jgi:hypothetical protein|nr:hypothetical protein [Gemmatimonadales bacterium]
MTRAAIRTLRAPPWLTWAAALCCAVGPPAAAQQHRPPPRPPAQRPSAELKENSPNPFYPATLIPFTIHPEECTDGHQPLVSLKVYNVLVQVVAIPVLQSSKGEVLENIHLPCGEHVALWDGRTLDGRADPAPGVYYSQLTVDGVRYTRKMIVRRPE